MITNQQLVRIEQQSSLTFGLRWSVVGLVIALCILSGCSSLFDSGTPRYNTVQGPKRAPNFNPGGVAAAPMQMASAPTMPPMMMSPQQAYSPYPVQGGGIYSQPMMPVYAPAQMQPQQIQPQMQQQSYPMPTMPAAPVNPVVLPLPQASAPAPMPPVISTPPTSFQSTDPTQGAPVRHGTMSSMDVPLAPDIQPTQPTNVPQGLIPPKEPGYMEESRYSQRRLGGK